MKVEVTGAVGGVAPLGYHILRVAFIRWYAVKRLLVWRPVRMSPVAIVS